MSKVETCASGVKMTKETITPIAMTRSFLTENNQRKESTQ